jgi:hypothetical protein
MLFTSILASSAVILSGLIAAPTHAAPVGELRVPIATINSSLQDGLNGAVQIRIGKSKPFTVMLDTGSVGLRLFPKAPKSGITKVVLNEPLPNGDQAQGMLGRATITIGKAVTTQKVKFQYINSTNPWIDGWQDQNVLGILGVGLKDSKIPNPLRYLSGKQASTWSISFNRAGRGELILGDAIPANALMHFPLRRDGRDRPDAIKYWDDHAAPGCWTFATTSAPKQGASEYCVDTWFDSGFPIMRIKGTEFNRIKVTPTKALLPGTTVRLAATGSAFAPLSFNAGNQGSRNTTRVASTGRAVINTGNSYFFDHRVYYNAATGDIYLNRLATERGTTG